MLSFLDSSRLLQSLGQFAADRRRFQPDRPSAKASSVAKNPQKHLLQFQQFKQARSPARLGRSQRRQSERTGPTDDCRGRYLSACFGGCGLGRPQYEQSWSGELLGEDRLSIERRHEAARRHVHASVDMAPGSWSKEPKVTQSGFTKSEATGLHPIYVSTPPRVAQPRPRFGAAYDEIETAEPQIEELQTGAGSMLYPKVHQICAGRLPRQQESLSQGMPTSAPSGLPLENRGVRRLAGDSVRRRAFVAPVALRKDEAFLA